MLHIVACYRLSRALVALGTRTSRAPTTCCTSGGSVRSRTPFATPAAPPSCWRCVGRAGGGPGSPYRARTNTQPCRPRPVSTPSSLSSEQLHPCSRFNHPFPRSLHPPCRAFHLLKPFLYFNLKRAGLLTLPCRARCFCSVASDIIHCALPPCLQVSNLGCNQDEP